MVMVMKEREVVMMVVMECFLAEGDGSVRGDGGDGVRGG